MTHEELLGLPPEGYKKILEMTPEELEIYLGPEILKLEPIGSPEIPDVDSDLEIEEGGEGDLIKLKSSKKEKKKENKKKDDEFYKLLASVESSEGDKQKLRDLFS